MKINSKDFRVKEGDEVNLKKWPTIVKPVYKSKKQYEELLRNTWCNSVRNSSFSTHPTAMRCC